MYKLLEEMAKKLPEKPLMVNEEVTMTNIYLAQQMQENNMIVDCGDPRSLIGRHALERYMISQGFALENLMSKPSIIGKFNFGETSYVRKEIVKVPIKIADIDGEHHMGSRA